MALRMRLQRHGKKNKPVYHIVVVDGRAPRDGKFIENIGTYVPTTNPATIDLNVDKALTWLHNGAQPSDTVNAILSYKGVLYKKHLLKGVTKGALTLEQAEAKFAAWIEEKEMRIKSKLNKIAQDSSSKAKEAMAAEVKIKEARAAELAKKLAEARKAEEEALAAMVAPEATPAEEAMEEAVEAVETPAE